VTGRTSCPSVNAEADQADHDHREHTNNEKAEAEYGLAELRRNQADEHDDPCELDGQPDPIRVISVPSHSSFQIIADYARTNDTFREEVQSADSNSKIKLG
jgi:hypothetical protein